VDTGTSLHTTGEVLCRRLAVTAARLFFTGIRFTQPRAGSLRPQDRNSKARRLPQALSRACGQNEPQQIANSPPEFSAATPTYPTSLDEEQYRNVLRKYDFFVKACDAKATKPTCLLFVFEHPLFTTFYSWRKATTGSTRMARRAGK